MDNRVGSAIVTTQPLPPTLGSAEPSLQDQAPRPYFPPGTIVTRSRTGETVSQYGDDKWDFRAQSKDGLTAQAIHFWRTPHDAADRALLGWIYEQHKALLWIIADRGDTIAFSALNRYASVAKDLCTIAYEKNIDLFTLLTDFEQIGAICDEMNLNGLAATNRMVQVLWRYRKELLVSSAQMQRDKIIEKIKAAWAKLPERKQTPLIPSRIYCSVLAGLLDGLDTIERDLDTLLEALNKTLDATRDIKMNFPHASREKIKLRRGCMLAETAEQMLHLGWKKGRGKSLHTFIFGRISAFQTHLMHTVAAFSGMRFGEVRLLPLNGVLETFQHRGQPHYLINGYTYKLHCGDKVATQWVTIDQGHRAIKLAMHIAEKILSLNEGKCQKGHEALLFPGILNPFKMMPNIAFINGQTGLINSISPEITAEDLDELNRLELERGWSRNGIELGKRWPLAMHQLRRSLSVYAHRSGMVSLPALKAQLQHITDEMRAYYADGWSRAVNLVFEKDHFSNEWNSAKTESTYFGLTGALRIAFDDRDDLLGHGAQRLEQIVSGRSREQTLALIKSGTIAYRETVLGGCMSTEECKTMPLSPINFECVESNCVNLVVRRKRLDLIISSQESVVAQLERDEEGSVAQRLEAEHLKRMLLARDRLKQAKTEKEAT